MIVGLEIILKPMSVRSWREHYLTPFASKASYCSKGVPLKGKSEFCSNVSHHRFLPVFFNNFFSQSFVDSGAITPLVVKTRVKGLNEDLNVNHSLVVLLLCFMLLTDLC